MEPKNPASPNVKTPPSTPAIHAPAPVTVDASVVIRFDSLTVTPGKSGALP